MSDSTPDAPSPEPLATPHRATRLPLDYYSSPASEVRAVFPRWVPIGCGAAATLLLAGVFLIGFVVAQVGVGSFMDMLFERMQSEMTPLYSKDVTAEQKKGFESEMSQLRANLRADKVKFAKLEPVMTSMRDAISDKSLTASEVDKLTKDIHSINAAPDKAPAKPR